MKNLECVEVTTSNECDAAIIWLHGLGADGHDFEAIIPELNLPNNLNIRFIFPHAPVRPVSLNNGMSMRAWFDIYSLDRNDNRQDESGILQGEAMINNLISKEVSRGIPSERIVLAGFSQGGALALFTGLRYTQPLAGIMGLSTYLPQVLANYDLPQKKFHTPVFLAHGIHDPILNYSYGLATYELLKTLAFKPEWHSYPIEHHLSRDEINDISAWLQKVLISNS